MRLLTSDSQLEAYTSLVKGFNGLVQPVVEEYANSQRRGMKRMANAIWQVKLQSPRTSDMERISID